MLNHFQRVKAYVVSHRTTIEFMAAGVTVISVVVSAFFYIQERPIRERNTISAAWQIVATMEGKKGSGGREKAIAQLKDYNEDLSGITLDRSFLNELDLSGTKLLSVSFASSTLSQSNFSGSHLSLAKFSSARLHKAQFLNVKIDLSEFYGAVITDANFESATFSQCGGDSFTTFNGSSFRNATMNSSKFVETNFDNINCEGCLIVETVLNGSRFRRGNLTRAIWQNVTAHSLDLYLTKAAGIKVGRDSDLRDSKIHQATFESARFDRVNLTNASFFGSHLKGAVFVDSDLTGVDFSSADLSGVKIERCNLNGAIFSGSTQSNLQVISCEGTPIDLHAGAEGRQKVN